MDQVLPRLLDPALAARRRPLSDPVLFTDRLGPPVRSLLSARSPAGELIAVGLLLLGVLVLFFLTPIATGLLLSPADLLLRSPPWRAMAGDDFEPANALLSDYVYQFRPWRERALAVVRTGRLPLWSPDNAAGLPFLGAGITAVLYPLNLPFLLLPETSAMIVWAIARLLVAGLGTYAFARLIGLTPAGAGVSGLAFGLSGFLVAWLLWPQVNVAVWLPALFLGTEGLVTRPSRLRILVVAAVVCVQFLGGHPETSLHVLAAAALYVIWRSGIRFAAERDRRRLAGRLAAFAGAVLLGTAGAAVQLAPFGEALLESATLPDRLADLPSFWSLPRPRWLALIGLVCPYCLGSSRAGDVPLGAVLGVGNFNELSGAYVGVLTLVLAALAVRLGARREIEGFFVALALLAAGVAFAVPPIHNLVHALPLFHVSLNERSLLLLGFALAMLAGRGADLVLATPAAPAAPLLRRTTVALGALAGVGLVLVAGAHLSYQRARPRLVELARARLEARGRLPDERADRHMARVPEYVDRLGRTIVREGTARVGLVLLSAIVLAVGRRSPRRRALTWLLPGVVALDLSLFGRDYNPSIPPALAYPGHPALDFLRRQPGLFRVLPLDGALPPNTNLMYGLSDVRVYSAIETPAYRRLLRAAGDFPRPYVHFAGLYFSNFASPLVDLLNVRFVLTERALDHPKLARVFQAAGMSVYENRAALPRAFLVFRARALDDAAAEGVLGDPRFDPRAAAVVEAGGPILSGVEDPAAGVELVEYEPERVVARVSTSHEALLVLSDAWYPGWRARVDEVPATIFRTNLLLRGVRLPPGDHRVAFEYAPRSFRLGLGISALAAVGSAVGLGWGVSFRRRPRS